MLVAMLSASTDCPAKPLHRNVSLSKFTTWIGAGIRIHHRDRNGRGMHPPAPFSRRHPLKTMAATFPFNGFDAWARQRQDQTWVAGALVRLSTRASLSGVAAGKAQVSTS